MSAEFSSIGLGIAIALGLPIASLWWALNLRGGIGYALYASKFARHSLGPVTSALFWVRWLRQFVETATGPLLAVLVGLIVVGALLRVRRTLNLSDLQRNVLWICLAAALPILVLGLAGINQNPRLVSPALFPLALVLAVLAAKTDWTTSLRLTAVAALLLVVQVVTDLCLVPFGVASGQQRRDRLRAGWLAVGDEP